MPLRSWTRLDVANKRLHVKTKGDRIVCRELDLEAELAASLLTDHYSPQLLVLMALHDEAAKLAA